MPYPVFHRNDYVDSIESVESLMESATRLVTDYILELENKVRELLTENENLREEIEKLKGVQ